MNTLTAASAPPGPTASSRAVRNLSQMAQDIVATWRKRARNRALLASFGTRMLEDVGISQADAWRETRKPFWRE